MFTTADGQNVLFTFILVSSLFLLWGFCNGMIDVMDKHFQEELGLNKSQSAWVQFAHYLGYFLMSIPAGWLASKLGYKGGIIAGLLLVAVGGFWFIPSTHINSLVHEGSVSFGKVRIVSDERRPCGANDKIRQCPVLDSTQNPLLDCSLTGFSQIESCVRAS